jgi:hypothetical protein
VCAGCASVPVTTAHATLTEQQTTSAILVSDTTVLADSAVEDAEKLLEVVMTTGDTTAIYVATKHVDEVKAIVTNTKAAKEAQKTERATTATEIKAVSAAEGKAQEVKAELEVTKVKSNTRLFIIIAACIAVLVFLAIKFRAVLKKVFPFLP